MSVGQHPCFFAPGDPEHDLDDGGALLGRKACS